MQVSWKKVGVEVIFKNEIPLALFGETLPKRKYKDLHATK